MTSLDAIFQTSLNQPDEKKRVSIEDAYRLADQEAYGFWNVTGKVAQRAARGFADATINTIDTASRGWSLIHQHLQNEFQGSPWAIGGPIPEEQRQIPRAMGAIEWMTGRSAPDTLDVLDTVGLIDDARRLRDLQSAELQDWEGPAAIAGELASFALPSGPAGIVGRGANNLARNVTHGAVLAKPVGRYLNRLVDAGEMTAEEAAKIAHSGQALVKIAEREGAGGFGRAVAAAGDAAPDLVGEYAALVAQSYAAAPRSEAAEAGKHAAMMGPLFVGIGRSARWLSGRVMDGTLSSSGKEALLKLHDSMNNGARPGLFRTMRALDPADAARVFGIEMLSTGLESTAFTLTNEDAFSALLDAYSGIPGSWGRFGGALAGTYAGVLMGKGLSNGELPYFRRVRPELNSIRTELDRQAAEHQANLARQTAEQQQRDDTTRRGTEAAKLVGDAMRGIEATADDTLAKIQAVSGDRVVSAFVDPMLRGGMTLEHARVNQPIPEIKLNSPEGYAVTARVLGPKTVMLDVDPQMWKLVMGTEHPGGPVSGSTAADFLNELGLRSSAMKMRGALHFGRMGMLESQAGVSWRNPETGIDYSFGLDGAVYQRPFGETTWRRLPKDDPIEWMIREPIGERPGEQSWWDPAMEAWARFAAQKARAFPDAFDEVLATAINTAQYGGNTASAQELRNLFLAMPPEQLISFLRPNNQKAIAHAIAAVGGGLSNHVEAQRLIAEAGRISESLRLPAPKPEPAPAADTPDEIARFEGEGGATLSELYGGLPLGEIGKALRAFAELTTRGDTTFARSEARMVPDKASQPNRPSRAGSLLDAYMADLPDVVGKYGGAEGERIRGDVVAANELGRDMQGQLQAEGYYSEALPRAEGRKGFRQAKQWLEATVEDGVYRTTRANLILENRMSAEGAPAGVQELLADYRKYRTMTGRWAESVQTVRPNRKTGNFEYFKTNEDAALAIRTNMSEAWMDAYARPFDPRSVEILRAVAAHPENRMDVAAQDAFIKRVQAEAKKVGAGDGPVELKSATEVLRELRFVPNEVQLNNGDWVVIRDPSIARAMDSMVRREWQGVMSRRAFGQDLPQAARQALNYQRMGPTETLQRMREASGNDDRAERALRTLMRRFEGASEEGWLPRFKGIAGTIQKLAYDAETLARTAAISGSAKQNIGEALATGTHLAGMPKVLRAMVRAAWSPRQVRRAALDAGALIDSIHGVDIRLHGGVMRAAAKVVGVPHRLSQGYAESVAFLVGESSLKSLSGGSEVARERARMLGFNEGEIASLASNEAPSSLRSRYVREVVKQMTAAKVPTEASSLAYNPKWNAIRAFDRWFMTRTRMTLKIGSRLFRAFQSKDPARIAAALANAAAFLVGSTASGALASYLAMVAKQQSFEEAWDQVRQEVGSAGLAKWLAKSGLGASLFGGTGYALYKTLADANATPEQKLVNLTTVGQRGLQIAEFLGGDGIYRDQSFGQKLVTAAPRMAPGLRDAQAVLAIAGLAEEADRFVAAREEKTKWLAEEGRLPRASQEPRDPEFSAAMRKLRDSIRAHATSMTPQEIVATPEFQDAMQGALAAGTGKDISRGLLARRELSGYSIEDLAKMRQRIGDANMGLLYTHDEAMELIAKAFTSKAGTDRAVFPSIDERIEEAERLVQLGGDAEVWRQLRDQVVDEAHEAIKAGGRPSEDIRRLARVLARYPESLDGLVGDRQLRAVRSASAPRAAQLIELFLIDTARRRISNDARDARQPR